MDIHGYTPNHGIGIIQPRSPSAFGEIRVGDVRKFIDDHLPETHGLFGTHATCPRGAFVSSRIEMFILAVSWVGGFLGVEHEIEFPLIIRIGGARRHILYMLADATIQIRRRRWHFGGTSDHLIHGLIPRQEAAVGPAFAFWLGRLWAPWPSMPLV